MFLLVGRRSSVSAHIWGFGLNANVVLTGLNTSADLLRSKSSFIYKKEKKRHQKDKESRTFFCSTIKPLPQLGCFIAFAHIPEKNKRSSAADRGMCMSQPPGHTKKVIKKV